MDGRHTPDSTIALGMPHLGAAGLCENWLLRTCGHLHWQAIAEYGQRATNRIVDLEGRRAFPSFVSCRIEGPLASFGENARAAVIREVLPRRDTAWRSVTRLETAGARAVRVELVSAFATRAGRSNACLGPATMTAPFTTPRGEEVPAPVRRLRARAAAARAAAAAAPEGPPLASQPVVAAADHNGVGLLYFANFLRFVALGERALTPRLPGELPVTAREIHYFGNADDGEIIDVSGTARVTSLAPAPSLTLDSVLRRRSDGAVIAACRTVRGEAEP